MAARYLGVNLAWREDRPGLPANETGVAVIDSQGLVLDAGWRRGVAESSAGPARWLVPGMRSCSWTHR